jgi:hypothetical protein
LSDNPKPFSDTELRILRFKLSNPGATNTEIAHGIGISRQHVRTLRNREPLQSALTAILLEIVEEGKEQALYGMADSVLLLRAIVNDKALDGEGRPVKSPIEIRTRAAAKLIDVFIGRDERGEGFGEDDWEAYILPSGGIKIQRKPKGEITAGEQKPPEPGDDWEATSN